MILEIIISLIIAIVILSLFFWTGTDNEDEYWALSELQCPHCESPYPIEDLLKRNRVFCEPPSDGSKLPHSCNGSSIHCPSCHEEATFFRTESNPYFSDIAEQPRLCKNCTERFMGLPDSTCPVCGESDHAIATE